LRWAFTAADIVTYPANDWTIKSPTAEILATYESEVRQRKTAIGAASLETVSKIGGQKVRRRANLRSGRNTNINHCGTCGGQGSGGEHPHPLNDDPQLRVFGRGGLLVERFDATTG
jgi:hypothetical protein